MTLSPCVLFPVCLITAQAFLALIERGMKDADVSVEKAAQHMKQDRAHLHRQLHGDGHLSAKRMADLPEDALRWTAVEILLTLGLPRQLQRAARLTFALVGHKRMAKADGRQQPQRRSA